MQLNEPVSMIVTLPLWAWIVVVCALAVFWLYTSFLAYTSILRAKNIGTLDRVGKIVKGTCYLIVIVGGLLDIAVNITLGTLFFFEPPTRDTLTLTARAQRHYDTDGFRGVMARWICNRLLNPFQENGHC